MATVYNWLDLNDNDELVFNPADDQLVFNDASIPAAEILVDGEDDSTQITFGAKTITLLTSVLSLTTSSVTFQDGSKLIIGDDATGTEGDDDPNAHTGTSFADQLVGVGGADSLLGGDGSDLFTIFGDDAGVYGDDTLDGGGGLDTIVFRDAAFAVHVAIGTAQSGKGGDADPLGDPYTGSALKLISIENVIGTEFNDSITGSNAPNYIEGGDGNDTLSGGDGGAASNDTLVGGAGDDRFFQTAGNDSILGGEGSDILSFPGAIAGPVTVNLAAGTSTATGSSAVIFDIERVFGTSAADTFIGGDAKHAPDGGPGVAEIFRGNGGNDLVNGMSGAGWITIADYANDTSAGGVTVTLGNSNNIGTAAGTDAGADTLLDVDRVRGGQGADSLVGGSYAQVQNGVFSERFRGNEGNDTIDGQGSDTTIGASGANDTAEYDGLATTHAIIVNLGEQDLEGTVYGTVAAGTARDGTDSTGGGTDTLIEIDGIIGSAFNDTIVGALMEHGNFRFQGGGGDDSLVGAAGGNNEADYSSDDAAVLVDLGAGTAAQGEGGEDGNDDLVNMNQARGSDHNDTLIGGNHEFERLMGGAGDDLIDGGDPAGVNYAAYQAAGSGVVASVSGGSGTASDGDGGTDTLENINGLWGSNFDDQLTGGKGDQWFRGRGGNDAIDGGDGIDTVNYDDPSGQGVRVDLGAGEARDGWGGIWRRGDGTLTIELSDATFTLNQVFDAENPIVGSWMPGDPDFKTVITFLSDGTYFLAEDGNTKIDPSGKDGMERGTYTWDAESGAFTSDTEVNTNGEWGLSHGTFDSVVIQGDSLVATVEGETVTLTRVSDTGLNGSWYFGESGEAQSSGVLTFLDNGRYLMAEDGDSTLDPSGQDGMEHGTWSWNPVTGAFSHSVQVNTNGEWGLSHSTVDSVSINGGFDTLANIENVEGSDFGDDLTGDDGDNLIDGLGGNDTLRGSEGRDTMRGGEGNDRFIGAVTEVNGLRSDARQSFEGGEGNDTLSGVGGDGRVTIADFRGATGGVIVNLGPDSIADLDEDYGVEQSIGGAMALGLGGDNGIGVDRLFQVDQVVGSAHDDLLIGGSNSRGFGGGRLEGFEGLAGDDTIDGGGGTNRIQYRESEQGVVVNLGSEAIEVDEVMVAGGTALDGWGGIDTLIDVGQVRGSDYGDYFAGGDSALQNQFEGGDGDDTIDGGDGIDAAAYFGADGAVVVNLGPGAIDLEDYGLAAEIVAGGSAQGIGDDSVAGIGVDTLIDIEGARGSDFDDILVGGGVGFGSYGIETFEGNAGNDTLDGGDLSGASIDIAAYDRSVAPVIVNLGGQTVIGGVTVESDTARDGYGVNGNPTGIDTLININGARGSKFNDTLRGGNGDNWLEGKRGHDNIDGGNGVDTIAFLDSPGGVFVALANLNLTTQFGVSLVANTALDGYGTLDTLSGIENVVGSGFGDWLQGSNGIANRFDGGAGNDTMNGGAVETVPGGLADTLLGGDGDDILRQSRGADVIDGGEGSLDRLEFNNNGIIYGTAAASVLVDLGAGTSNADRENNDAVNGADVDVATISNIEQVFGTGGNDILIGGSLARASSDTFVEVFRGHGGNDIIDGVGEHTDHAGRGFVDRVEYSSTIVTGGVIVNIGTDQYVTGGQTIEGGTALDGMGGIDTLLNIDWVVGSAQNDILVGGNAASDFFERFEGRQGNDTIDGGRGIDDASYIGSPTGVVVNLGLGVAFDGWGTTDALFNMERARGSRHADVLIGSDRLDVIEMFIGEEGNDTIDGGDGIDFATWRTKPTEGGGVNVTLGIGGPIEIDDGFGDTDTLIDIEGLDGSNADDTLAGGDGGDWWFRGRGGSDVLDGGNGTDTADYSTDYRGVIVNLGGGQVVVDIGEGEETVEAGTARDGFGGVFDLQGTDTLIDLENVLGSTLDDYIAGSAGVNLLDGNEGNDTIDGGDGDDTLAGGAGDDSLSGGSGEDTLDGGEGNDILEGGEDNDVFVDSQGDDVLDGGLGDDTFLVGYTDGFAVDATGGDGVDVYVLGTGSDYDYEVTDFVTGPGGDQIDVSAILTASAAAGFYAGGDPFDLGFLQAVDDTNGNTELQWDFDGAGTEHDPVTGIRLLGVAPPEDGRLDDNILGLAIGNDEVDDNIEGGDGNDLILGLGGADSLSGGAGDDVMFGGEGADTMTGGAGSDTYHVDDAGDVVVEEAEPGLLVLPGGGGEGAAGLGDIGDTVIAAINFSLGAAQLQFIENVRLFGDAARATGNALANALTGTAGSNFLSGSTGNDTLDGGAGKDTMDGGKGNDLFLVDSATDVVKEGAKGGGIDTVQATVSEKLDANVEHLELLGSADLKATGNALHNALTGNAGRNLLVGDAGNDTLDGGAGNDTMNGGAGNDLYFVDAAGDKIGSEASGSAGGNDTVVSSVTRRLEKTIENLLLTGNLEIDGTGNALANRITGNANDNHLVGSGGNDTITGGAGSDTLDGGGGSDRMTGGEGDDVYVVDSGSDRTTEAAGGGIDTVKSSVTETLELNVENLELTGSQAINGTGNVLDNSITGNGKNNRIDGVAGDDNLDGGLGNDTLIGGVGNDTLNGGAGSDSMNGGAGDDLYFVDADGDKVIDGGIGDDTVVSSVSEALSDNIESLVLVGEDSLTGHVDGTGNALDNTITGNAFDNFLNGAGGSDTVLAEAGDDTLVWDPLDGVLDGGEGDDLLLVTGNGVTLDLTGIEEGRIVSIQEIDLTGSGDNTLLLTAADVLAISETELSASAQTLAVTGNDGDAIDIGTDWTDEGPNEDGYVVYTQTLRSAELTLLVHGSVTVLGID